MRYRSNLVQKLKKEIVLSDVVENKVQDAYSQIRKQNKVSYVPYRKCSKGVVAAAICAVVFGVTITGIAVSVYFTKYADYAQDTVTYKFDIDYELIPGEYEVNVDYIPKGYVNKESGKNSYETEEGKEYFTILPIMNTVDLDKQQNIIQEEKVKEVEHTILSGMEADVITYQEKDKYEMPTNIYLFNSKEGYVIWIHGSYEMPVDELKKVADSLTVTRVGDSEDSYLTDVEKEELIKKQKNAEQEVKEYKEKGILIEQIIPLGESFSYPTAGYNGSTEENIKNQPETTTFMIEDVEVIEKLSGIEPEKIFEFESIVAPWLNSDGSLKSYTRQYYHDGEVLKEETVEQMFLKVKVKVKYEFNEEKADKERTVYDHSVGLNAELIRLGKKNGDHYEYAEDYYMPVPAEHNELQMDHSAIGFSKPQYDSQDSQFFFRTMEDGETLEYELLFVIDKDLMEENVVLSFDAAFNGGTIYPNTLNGSYFAIKE